MTPAQLKTLQTLVTAAATSLEAAQLLPPGVVAAIATLVSFGLGLIHPAPAKSAPRD